MTEVCVEPRLVQLVGRRRVAEVVREVEAACEASEDGASHVVVVTYRCWAGRVAGVDIDITKRLKS